MNMNELVHLCTTNPFRSPLFMSYPSRSQSRSRLLLPPLNHLSSQSSPFISLNPKKPPKFPSISPPPTDPTSPFSEKMLYLESMGLDLFSLIDSHRPIVSASLSDIKSTVDFLRYLGFSPSELRRIFGMCPDILTARPSSVLAAVTFLLREARIDASSLRRVINRRPRLLTSDVAARLRPSLYFLQMLGIADVRPHTSLLSCSVEDKLLPRLDYLQRIGFSRHDSMSMLRHFPALFCYSIEENFEPKFEYFVFEMGRELKELREFPQYFSFSLEKRIKPRHQTCVELGVCLPLHALLKGNDKKFFRRLEVCIGSSPPLRSSPLCSASCFDGDCFHNDRFLSN